MYVYIILFKANYFPRLHLFHNTADFQVGTCSWSRYVTELIVLTPELQIIRVPKGININGTQTLNPSTTDLLTSAVSNTFRHFTLSSNSL
jgi:hypothetical protein